MGELFPVEGDNWPARDTVRICGPCNSRLNDMFETPCRPIITALISGNAVELRPRDQILAARWLLKTALVHAVCNRRVRARSGENITDSLRTQLLDTMTTGFLPSASVVRIGMGPGTVEGGTPLPPGRTFTVPPIVMARPTMSAVASQGYLVWEVTVGLQLTDVQPLIEVTADDDWLTRIWPVHLKETVHFPPRERLSYNDFQAIGQAWRHVPEIVAHKSWRVDRNKQPGSGSE